jgi:sialate O-acetylesterase
MNWIVVLRGYRFVLAVGITVSLGSLRAEVQLPKVFGSHMVLQRDMPIPVWGWAAPGETIRVRLGQLPEVTTTADTQGAWRVNLPAQPAGGPWTLVVASTNQIVFEDVWIGEVWLCSGQSNMEWPVRGVDRAEEEIAAARWPQIRCLRVQRATSALPRRDFEAQWAVCSPETVAEFTAVGYFFAREIHRTLDVPIGLLHSAWGGTRIEPWTPPDGFGEIPTLRWIRQKIEVADPRSDVRQARLRQYIDRLDAWIHNARIACGRKELIEPAPAWPTELTALTGVQDPSALWNAMVYPMVPYAMRGVLWYQGESNHSEGMAYVAKMQALIQGWRGAWGMPNMPFFYVMIAPFQYGNEDPEILPRFWEAQVAALKIPHTGMAVIHDLGDLHDIHPRNKQEVGRRLARLALADVYKHPVVARGPLAREMVVEQDRIRVRFDHADGGLKTRDGQPPSHFELCGNGTTGYVPARAVIEGDSVVLSSPSCPTPTGVRFAWHKLAMPNLVNAAGLPAAPFRLGDYPQWDATLAQIPEVAQYQLVYDLNLARLGPEVIYDEERSGSVTGRFDRVAYLLELQKGVQTTTYVYVSMDAFSDDPRKLGVPVYGSGIRWQQPVHNLWVASNVGNLPTESIPVGFIEFWPNNYTPMNAAQVPSASNEVYDWGDQPVNPENGYGCMQIHVPAQRTTLWAINHWSAGGAADIGIGNSTGATRDWTFTGSASQYSYKRLRVFVRPVRR